MAQKPDGDTLGSADVVAGNGNWYANTSQPLETAVPLPPGTYLIKVYNGNATYKLTTSFEAVEAELPEEDPGDAPDTASPLGDLTSGSEVSVGGYVGPADSNAGIEYDLYEFEVTNNGTLHIMLGEVSAGKVYLQVAQKPDGDTLGSADVVAGNGNWYANTSQPLETAVPLPPGTYLIKVYNGNATYKLTTSFEAVEAELPEEDSGDAPDTASPLGDLTSGSEVSWVATWVRPIAMLGLSTTCTSSRSRTTVPCTSCWGR